MVEITDPSEAALRPPPELVSIVVPVFNEAGNVRAMTQAVAAALPGTPYEFIFVDDGSSDATFDEITAAAAADPRVCGIRLARNFGHQYALAAGMENARGQAVITMDGDLQHPPALLPRMIEKWREGYQLVQGRRNDTRHVGWLKRTTSRAYYRMFSALCGIRLEPGTADFRLIDRSVLDQLSGLRESRLFLRGLLSWMGCRAAVIPFDVEARHSGASKYTFGKMFRLAKSGLFSFSPVPLRIGVWVGIIMAVLSFGELIFALVAYLTTKTVPGWTSMVALTSLLFGILFLLMGLQGEYLLRIYERVQQRPLFVIDRVVRKKDAGQAPRATKPPTAP